MDKNVRRAEVRQIANAFLLKLTTDYKAFQYHPPRTCAITE